MRHFLESCSDNGLDKLRFIIADYLNNADDLAADEIDDLFLKEKKMCIKTLITQHCGLDSML